MPSLFLKVKAADRRLFEKTFNVSFANYFDGMFGFDIVKLNDEVVKPPKNKSMEATVLKNYGQEAVDLIKRLNKII